MLRHRMAGVALALITVFAPAAAEAKPSGYISPGYKGTTSFGKKVVATPLAPITIGTGKYPNLIVDAAGTGHVVYTQDGGTDAPDTVVSCLLQRGQKQCAAGQGGLAPVAPEGGTPGPFEGNFPGGNHDFDGAVPLNVGNSLFVVDRRFPDVFTAPDSSTQESNVFLWSSDDGGATLTGPGIIGDNQMAGGAIAFGGSANPSIGTLSATKTDGTWFQGSQVGTYVRSRAWLGRPPFLYDGSVALDGDLPIAAFSDANGTVMVRRYTGTGDVNDSPNWSQATFPGFSPHITSGPSGVFVMYRDAGVGGNLLVRRITGGQPAAAGVKVAGATGQPTITENPAGGLAIAYTDDQGVELQTSTNGTSWTPPSLVAKIASGDTISGLTAAATGDGGGFATYIKSPQGAEAVGSVVLSAFGTQRATGLPGLGPLPGGGIGSAIGDQLATTTCTTAKFGNVTAETNASCFGRDPSDPSMAVSLGEVNLNGLRIIPDPGVKIGINPKKHSIDTTGKVRVVLSAAGLDITLWHDQIHAVMPTAEAGTDLFDFKDLPSPPDVVGFPISGEIDVKITDGGAKIPISLGLPKVFGGVTGSTTLVTTLRGGLELDSLEFKVPDANFKALEIKNLDISYTRTGSVWKGTGTVQVPAGGGIFSLSVDIEFADGQYQKGSIDLGLPYPGIPLDVNDTPPQLFFTHGGLGLGLDPLTITGTAGFGLSPFKAPGTGALRDYVFSVDGTLSASFGDPITLTASAQGYLQALQIANGKLVYQLPSRVTLTGEAGYNLGIFEEKGTIQAIFDPKAGDYAGRIGSDIILHLDGIGIPTNIDIPGLTIAVNKRGFAVYIPFGATPFFFGTITYEWGDLLPVPHPAQDVTGRYTAGLPPLRGGGARTADTTAFEVPKGAKAVDVEVSGAGGAPTVVLTDPSGTQITPTTTAEKGTGAFAFGDVAASATHVGLQSPVAGRWNVTQAPGSSVPVTGVRFSVEKAQPSVKAKVGGTGRARTLSYTAALPSGVTVQFAEKTSSLLHVIGTAKGSKGTIRFTPGNAPAGKRQIVALIDNEGLPLSQPVVATYTAPGPPVPGRAKSVKVSSSSKSFTIAWTPPPGAFRTLVAISASDGRRIQRVVPASTKKLSVPVIGFKDAISVSVTGLSQTGKKGPAARAKSARKT